MSFDLFHSFNALDGASEIVFNKEYAELSGKAGEKIAAFKGHEKALYGDVREAYDALSLEAKTKADAFKALGNDAEPKALQEAKAAADKAEKTFTSFLRGESEFNRPASEGVAALKVKLSNVSGKECGKELMESFKEAQHAAGKVSKPANSFLGGIVRTQEGGWKKALDRNLDSMNVFKEGATNAQRGKAFAHGALVAASATAIIDGVVHTQTKDGDERSGWVRGGEVLAGAAALSAALVGGGAKSLARV